MRTGVMCPWDILPVTDTDDQSAFPAISVSQILRFETQIVLRFVPVASAVVHVLLCHAHGISDKQFVYADRTVIST